MSLLPDVRIGSQRPTFLSQPVDRRGSAGEEAVELAALAGLVLDDWQAWLLDEMLSIGSDGRWSAFEVAAILPRQNGKGGLLEARQLFGLFLGGEQLAVHTAHEFKTCFEHFLRVKSLIESTPDLDSRVQRIRLGAGEQAIELKNGQRLRFLARTSGSGRGLSGDTVYLDEAFALTPEIIGALLPTLSAVPNPQVVYTSSHPKFTQQVLYALVQRGRAAGSDRLLYAEWGNGDDVANDDRTAWSRANPALGIRISEEIIEAELAAMSGFPDEFRRERLGIVVDDGHISVFDPDKWRAVCGESVVPADPLTFAVDVSPDRDFAAIVAAGRDGSTVACELVDYRPGTGWLAERCAELKARHRGRLVLEARSPAAAVGIVGADEIASADAVNASGALFDAVADGCVQVRSDVRMQTAVTSAAKKTVGDAWRFARRTERDVSPLIALSLAHWAVASSLPVSAGVYSLADFLDDDDE